MCEQRTMYRWHILFKHCLQNSASTPGHLAVPTGEPVPVICRVLKGAASHSRTTGMTPRHAGRYEKIVQMRQSIFFTIIIYSQSDCTIYKSMCWLVYRLTTSNCTLFVTWVSKHPVTPKQIEQLLLNLRRLVSISHNIQLKIWFQNVYKWTTIFSQAL
jgi:hypothetical protein